MPLGISQPAWLALESLTRHFLGKGCLEEEGGNVGEDKCRLVGGQTGEKEAKRRAKVIGPSGSRKKKR